MNNSAIVCLIATGLFIFVSMCYYCFKEDMAKTVKGFGWFSEQQQEEYDKVGISRDRFRDFRVYTLIVFVGAVLCISKGGMWIFPTMVCLLIKVFVDGRRWKLIRTSDFVYYKKICQELASEEYTKAKLKKFYEEVVSGNQINKVDEYVSEECIFTKEDRELPIGLEGAKEYLVKLNIVYPDYQIRITRQYRDYFVVISEFEMKKSHHTHWYGFREREKEVEFVGVNIDRVEKGKIVRHTGVVNAFER